MLFLLGEFNLFTFQSFLDRPVQVLVICRMDFHEVGYFDEGTVTHGGTCETDETSQTRLNMRSVRGICESREVCIMQNNSVFKP